MLRGRAWEAPRSVSPIGEKLVWVVDTVPRAWTLTLAPLRRVGQNAAFVEAATPVAGPQVADVVCRARVTWGSGGVQATAWVDWPVQGAVVGLAGSRVEVVGEVWSDTSGVASAALPVFAAFVAEGAAASSTLTLTHEANVPPAVPLEDTPGVRRVPVPPFARSVEVLVSAPDGPFPVARWLRADGVQLAPVGWDTQPWVGPTTGGYGFLVPAMRQRAEVPGRATYLELLSEVSSGGGTPATVSWRVGIG